MKKKQMEILELRSKIIPESRKIKKHTEEIQQ